MIRTQVQFTEEQMEALRARAARQKVSVSEIVRRAVTFWVGRSRRASPEDLRRRAIEAAGRFGSGCTDTARRHDQVLAGTFGR